MMNKTMKRILTMALAVIMALSSLSGAFPTAFADEDVYDGLVTAEEPGEEPAEEPTEEPSQEPAEEPTEEPGEEPSQEPTEEPYDVEPEPEPEPVIETAALDAVLIVSNEEAVRLTTDEGAVLAEAVPELRLWSEEEKEEYGALLEGIEGEVFAKLALYDAVTEERGISLTGTVNVKLSGGIVENAAELRAYTVTESGELLELELDDNAFEADCVSLLVLAGTEKEEPAEEPAEENDHSGAEIYDNLVETPASNDEPLLQLDELSDETLAFIGIERDGKLIPMQTPSGSLRPGAGAPSGDGGNEANEDGLMPWESDNISINNLTIKWIPNSYGETVDPVHFHYSGTGSTVPVRKFQIEININGTEIIKAGALEIVLPAYLWRTRPVRDAEGNIVTLGAEAGTITFDMPEEPDHSQDLAWRRVGDYIVITNTHMMAGSTAAFIQGSISGEPAYEMEDATDSRLYSDFNPQVSLTVGDTVLTRKGNMTVESKTVDGETVTEYVYTPIYATIDTCAYLYNARKGAVGTSGNYNLFTSIPSSIPNELLPANASSYIYVRWAVTGEAKGNQPYTMSFSDTIADDGIEGAIMLGAEALSEAYNNGSTVKVSEDKETINGVMYSGNDTYSKTVIVWTAYPKSSFSGDDDYRINNTATITVKGVDEDIPGAITDLDNRFSKTRSASAYVTYSLPKSYSVTKEWDHKNNREERYPTSVQVTIYRDGYQWNTVTLSESNNWTYYWSDDDIAHKYSVYERNLPSGKIVENGVLYDGRIVRIYTNWNYSEKSKTYDADTHKWTILNEYSEYKIILDKIPFHNPEAKTKTTKSTYRYTNYSQQGSGDSLLNALGNGETIDISYSVSGRGEFLDYTYGGDYNPGYVILEHEYDRFGQRPACYEVSDEAVSLIDSYSPTGAQEFALSSGDYDIYSVTMPQPTLYLYWQVDEYAEWEYKTDNDMSFEAKVVLYGRAITGTDEDGNVTYGDWVEYAARERGYISAKNEATVAGGTVYLPSGVHQVKQQLITKAHGAVLAYNVNIRIYPSEHVKEIIEPVVARGDYFVMSVKNAAKSEISDPDPEHSDRQKIASTTEARAYIHGRNYKVAVSLEKQYDNIGGKKYSVDANSQIIKFSNTVTLTQQSNVTTSREDYLELIEGGALPNSNGGTFYDLLPAGVQPDLDSLMASVGDEIVDAYVRENWRGSGRTMMVVKVRFSDRIMNTGRNYGEGYPTTGYANVHFITYESYTPFLEVYNRQTSLGVFPFINSVAFEADEDSLGNMKKWEGEPDKAYYDDDSEYANKRTKSELTAYGQDDRQLMTDLDPNSDRPSFVYAGAKTDLSETLLWGVLNAEKQISVDGITWNSGAMDVAVNVNEGSTYTYRITVDTITTKAIKDVTIFDPLETFRMNAEDSTFRGVIESVDTSVLESFGMNVRVYYYVGDELQGCDNREDVLQAFAEIDVTDSEVWKTEMPADRSTVKAILIKAEKSDENYYFGKKMVVDIHMRAPVEKVGESEIFPDASKMSNPEYNAHAYNFAVVLADLISEKENESDDDEITAQTVVTPYTKLGILPYSIIVEKTWIDQNDNDGVRPDSITVHLYGDDELVDTIVITAENGWHGAFSHVRKYRDNYEHIEYTVKEDAIEVDGVALYTTEVKKEVDGNGATVFSIINTHELYRTTVPFVKTWDSETGEDDTWTRPESITVDLYRKDLVGTETDENGEPKYRLQFMGKRMTVTKDENGNWHGEFSGDTLYKYNNKEEVEYVVREIPVYKYYTVYDESTLNHPVIKNVFYPYGDLEVTKTVENATAAASEGGNGDFTFTLLLSYNGEESTELYIYNIYNGEEIIKTGKIGNGGEFTLRDGQRIVIKNIYADSTYEVVEAAKKGYSVTSQFGSRGTITAHETQYASFVNTYTTSASADVSLTKVLKGGSISFKQFSFSLIDAETGKIVGTAYTSTAQMDMNTHETTATVLFPRLYFTSADNGKTYRYIIKEDVPENSADYYTYDDSEYTFTITLNDNGKGTMEKTVAYGGTESETTPPTFVNEYHAKGETSLKAWKTLKGGKVYDYDFEFELLDASGVQISTAKCEPDGTIVFPAIEFDENDAEETFLYIVREINKGDEAVIYDDNVFGYNVRPTDRGDGTLMIRNWVTAVEENESGEYAAVDGDVDPVFNNSLKSGSLSVTNIEKWKDGQEPSNKDIKFHVEFYGEILPDTVNVRKDTAHVITVGVGGQFMTLQEAFDAAEDGDTIVLVSDLNHQSTATLRGGKSVTLDLKDYTIQNNASGYAVVIAAGNELTLEGGSWVGGNLFNAQGELTIESGEYYADNTLIFAAANADGTETVTVNGGYFEGGSIRSNQGANWIIYGGQFNDVSFYGDGYPFCYGGSYTENPSDNVPQGYKVITGADTIPGYSGRVYTVIPDPDAPMVVKNSTTGEEFASLNLAVRAASSGDTIVPLADLTLSEKTLISAKSITLDFEGYNINVTRSEAITAQGDSTNLIIDGGSWTGTGTALLVKSGAELIIADGTFTFEAEKIVYVDAGGHAEISGGHLKSGVVYAASNAPYGFEIKNGAISLGVTFTINNDSWPYISGGLFEINPELYKNAIMPGYYAAVSETGEIPGYSGTVYTVKSGENAENEYAIKNLRTGELYHSLSSAFKAAESGDTLQLLSSYSMNYEAFPAGMKLTLDLNGFAITADDYADCIFINSTESELTVRGGKWVMNGSDSLFKVYAGTLNVESGSWTGTNGTLIYAGSSASGYGTVNISGGDYYSTSTLFYASSVNEFNITDGDFGGGKISGGIVSGGIVSNNYKGYSISAGIFRKGISFTGNYNGGFITGGLFAMELDDFSDYVANGYRATDKGDIIEGYTGKVYSIVKSDGEVPMPFHVESSGKDYETLYDAVSGAASEDIITVTDNATVNATTISGKKITVRGGEYQLEIYANAKIGVRDDGELTIEGGNWIDSDSRSYNFLYVDGGKLIINSGVFTTENCSTSFIDCNNAQGEIEISGGEFNFTGNLYSSFLIYTYRGSIKITGGKFNYSGDEIIVYSYSGTIYISGGEFFASEGAHAVYSRDGGQFSITGGYFSGSIYLNDLDSQSSSITGGYFTQIPESNGKMFISGGYYAQAFTGDSLEYLKAGYYCTETDESDVMEYEMPYKVAPDPNASAVARIVRDGEELRFFCLEDACADALDGEVIELISDVEMRDEAVVKDKNVSLDCGDHEIYFPDDNKYITVENGSLAISEGYWHFKENSYRGNPVIRVKSGGELTINGGEWVLDVGSMGLVRANSGAKVTINSGEFDLASVSNSPVVYADSGADVVINGGFFELCYLGGEDIEVKGGKFSNNVTFTGVTLTGGYYALDPEYINLFTENGYEAVEAENVKIPYFEGTVYTIGKTGDPGVITANMVAANVRSGAEYEDLHTAIIEAEDGDTVILLRNAGLDSETILAAAIIIDLNGKTLTVTRNGSFNMQRGADLTVTGGNWSFVDSTAHAFRIYSGAKMTVKDGSFKKTNQSWYYMFQLYGGELNIEGGSFDWYGQYLINGDSYSSNKLIITGGEFSDTYSGSAYIIYWDSSSGTSTNSVISGGTFKKGIISIGNRRSIIKDGVFMDGVSFYGQRGYIRGGLFAMEAYKFENYIATGYTYEETEETVQGYSDTVYRVVPGESVQPVVKDRKSGELYYSLEESLNLAENYADLELLSDVTMTNGATVSGKTISLDLNGHTVVSRGQVISIGYNGKLTVDGGEWISERTVYEANEHLFNLNGSQSTLYIKGGSFTQGASNNTALIYINSNTAKGVIIGGTFNCNNLLYAISDADHFSAITGGEFIRGIIDVSNSDSLSIVGGSYSPEVELGKWGHTFRVVRGGSFGKSEEYLTPFCAPGYKPYEDSEATMAGYEDTTFYTVGRDDSESTKVAMIVESGAQYLTLEDAINSAGQNQTVKLLADVEISSQLEIAFKKLTLDPNDHTISFGNSGNITLSSSTRLTLRSGGTWAPLHSSNGYDFFIINPDTELTVEGGTFNGPTDSRYGTYFWRSIFTLNGGTLTIKDGDFTAKYGAVVTGKTDYPTSKLVIEDGEFSNYTVNTSYTGRLISWQAGCGTENTSVISGGVFKNTVIEIFNNSLTITGGKFYNAVTFDGGTGYKYIKGGYYSMPTSKFSSYVYSNYEIVEYGERIDPDYADTVYTVQKINDLDPIATDNNGKEFYDFESIGAEADNGTVVTMLQDVEAKNSSTYSGWQVTNKGFTLDLNGHTVSTDLFYISVGNGASLTVKGQEGSKFDISGHQSFFRVLTGGSLTIQSGSFEGGTWDSAKVGSSSVYPHLFDVQGGELNIVDGEFKWAGYYIISNSSYNYGTVVVDGGDFTGTGNGILNMDRVTSAVINGGIFRSGKIYVPNDHLTINDGKFYSGVTFTRYSTIYRYISGGYYAMDPELVKPYLAIQHFLVEAEETGLFDDYEGTVYKVIYDPDYYEAEDDLGNKYYTLDLAIDNAPDGSTVKVLRETSITYSHEIYRNLAVDLNGQTVNFTGGTVYVQRSKTLILEGEGKWSISNSATAFTVNDGGLLTVTGGTFERTNTNSYYLFHVYGGELTITGGTFDWTYSYIIYAYEYSTSKLIIEGGDFTNRNGGILYWYWQSNNGSTNRSEIKGGMFRKGSINIYNALLRINDGSFLSEVTFNGYSSYKYIYGGLYASAPNSTYIRTGFKAAVSERKIEGYEDSVAYEIVFDPNLAIAIDDTGRAFASVDDITSNAATGTTITFYADVTWNSNWYCYSKDITLDLNGHTITIQQKTSYSNYIQVYGSSNITLRGGTWKIQGTSNYAPFIIKDTSKITVESGTFERTDDVSGKIFEVQSELYISGGEFKGNNGTVIYLNGDSYTPKLTIAGGDFSASSEGYIINCYMFSSTPGTSEIVGGTFGEGKIKFTDRSVLIKDGCFTNEETFDSSWSTSFIVGGLYAFAPESGYIANGLKAVLSDKEIDGYEGDVYEIVEDPDAVPIAVDEEGTNFYSFEDIISGAQDGSTVTLIKDLRWNSHCTLRDKAFTLDLGDFTITASRKSSLRLIYGGGLTVKGGTWKVGSNQDSTFDISVGGKMTVEGGSFEKTLLSDIDLFHLYLGEGELHITGGTFIWNTGAIILKEDDTATQNFVLTVGGGDFSNTNDGYILYWGSDGGQESLSTVNGGTFRRGKISINNDQFFVKDGTFMSGVPFTLEEGTTTYYKYVKGGLYANDPSTFVCTGYKAQISAEKIDGYEGDVYEIVSDPDAVAIAEDNEGRRFFSFADVIRDSVGGTTVTFLTDLSISESWIINEKKLTFDFGEHNISVSDYGALILENGAELTLKGGTWSISSSEHLFQIRTGSKLTVESGTFTKTSNTSCICFSIEDGELLIEGGTFSWKTATIIDSYSGWGKFTITGGDFTNSSKYYQIIYCFTTAKIKGGIFRTGEICMNGSRASITDGIFLSNVILSSTTETPGKFVCGGYYATKPNAQYIKDGYTAAKSSETVDEIEGDVYEIIISSSAIAVADDGTAFTTFKSIFNASDGATVKLLKDVTWNEYAYPSGKLTLDLDGHKVTVSGNTYLSLYSNSSLTIRGGTWDVMANHYVFSISSGGKLVVESGTFNRTNSYSYSLFDLSGGELDIQGGTYTWKNSYLINASQVRSKLTISGGDFTATGTYIIYWRSGCGTGNLSEIRGGIFREGSIFIDNTSLSITGGSFLSGVSFSGSKYIRGGLYASEPSDSYIVSGYLVVESEQEVDWTDGTVYEIIEDPDNPPEPPAPPIGQYIAQDDEGNYYETMTEVLNNSKDGAVITFLKGAYIGDFRLSNKKLTFDLQDKNLQFDATDNLNINSGADLTIKGGTWTASTGTYSYTLNKFRVNSGGKLTIESGRFASTSYNGPMFTLNGGELVINGGEFAIAMNNSSKYGLITGYEYSTNKLTINGGDFTGMSGYIIDWKAGSGTETVSELKGGEFKNGYFVINNDTLKIKSGTYPSGITINSSTEYKFIEGGVFGFNPRANVNLRFFHVVTDRDTIDGFSGTVYSIVEKETAGTGSSVLPTYIGAPGRLLAAPIMVFAPAAYPNGDGDPANPDDGGESANVSENVVTFTLSDGETITINDLPASVNYRVWEETPEGWTLVAVSGETGTIKPLETSSAVFTNEFDAGSTSVTLSGTKYLDGALSDESFSFTVHQVSGPVEIADRTVTSAAGGVIPLGTYALTDTGDYVFAITENDPDDKYVKDTHTEYVTVKVALNESNVITASVTYDESGAKFYNYTKPGVINVKKSIDDSALVDPGDKMFTFKVTLSDRYGGEFTDDMRAKNADGYLPIYVELPDGTTVDLENATATFSIKANQTAYVKNVPENVSYQIEETDMPSGWSLKRWIGQNTATMTANGSVNVTALNTYVPGSVTKGFASITVHKTLVGADVQSGAFTFELYALENAEDRELTDGKRVESVTNGAVDNAGTVAGEDGAETANPWLGTAPARFSDILYTDPGEYYYAIREIRGTDVTIDYDDHVEYVTVTVTDSEDGRLSASVEYDADGALFTNRMKTATLRVEKTLRAATAAAGEKEFDFTLILTSKDGTALTDTYTVTIGSLDAEVTETRTVDVTNGGIVSIKGGEYFEVEGLPHNSTYEITETQRAGFDRTEVNGEEGLTAEGTITAGEMSIVQYVNYYSTSGSLNNRVNPVIKKIFNGGTIEANQFKFNLYEVTTDGEGVETETLIESAYANEDGTIFFGEFEFTAEDDGKTYSYRVYEETDAEDYGTAYDSEPINLTITVRDNGEGELVAEVVKDREAFTNYRVYMLTISKSVRGEDEGAEYGFTARFELDGAAYEPLNVPESWEKKSDGVYRFKLKDGESASIRVLAGVTYTVEEEASEDYSTEYEIASSNGADTVSGVGRTIERTVSGDFGNETVTVINMMRGYKITVTKQVEGSDEAKAREYEFSISFTKEEAAFDPESVPESWTKSENGVYTFSLRDGGSTEVWVPENVTYTVTETTEGFYTEYTVTSDSGAVTSGTGRSAQSTIESTKGSETVAFVNSESGSLTISKEVAGSMGNTLRKFNFELDLGEYELPTLPEGWTKLESGAYSFSLGHGERVTVVLPIGTAYKIVEEADENYKVTVSVNGAEATEGATVEGTISSDNLMVTCAYVNTREAVVPTGADIPLGTAMLMIPVLGLAAYLIFRRRKREED